EPMSAHDSHHAAPAEPEQPLQIGTGVIAFLLAAVGVAVLLSRFMDNAALVVAAGVVGALAPKRHGWNVRAALGIICALFMVFVLKTWVVENAEPPETVPVESKTLLSWILGLPIAG